jgi:hypothetical protein
MPTPDSFELPNLRKKKFPAGAGPGRIRGLQNRITRDLKLSIIEAAALHGGDGKGSGGVTGYCLHLATNHPKAFAMLIGKMLPLQIDAAMQSVVGEVKIISIPAGDFLTPEAMAKFRPAQTIEHEPAIEQPT